MVRHIVCWNYQDGFTDAQNAEHACKIKEGLERLKGIIDGIVSLEVIIDPLESGQPDLILNAVFVDEDALKKYQVHEEHVKVGQYIGSVTQNRYCIDYIEK